MSSWIRALPRSRLRGSSRAGSRRRVRQRVPPGVVLSNASPKSPANCFARAYVRAPLTRLILPTTWAEKRYRNGIPPLGRWRPGARVPEAVTLPTGTEMGIVPLEHRASDDIITMSVEGIFDVGRSPPTRTGADHGNAL